MQMFFDKRDTLRAALDKLSPGDQTFANSLLSRRFLSDKQWPWIDKLIERAAKENQDSSIQIGTDFAGVVSLLDKAATRLKHPKLLVRVEGKDYRLSIAGPTSRAPGSINVLTSERSFGDRTWYGRVTREGKFEPSRAIDEQTATAVGAALKALAADPAKVASEYGRMTGSCCFCGLELTDARSIHVGYGAVCAKKWDMPYGDKPEPQIHAPNNTGVYLAPRHDSRSAAAKRGWTTRKESKSA